jgi:hypothetical protein
MTDLGSSRGDEAFKGDLTCARARCRAGVQAGFMCDLSATDEPCEYVRRKCD